jgi:predicted nucleotidyltransferase
LGGWIRLYPNTLNALAKKLKIMGDKRLIERIVQIVLESTGNSLISLYLVGSFLTKDMIKSSDIDLVGVMESSFDFEKEKLINERLNGKIVSKHKIDLGTMSVEEFFGGKQKGSLMRHMNLPVFLDSLKNAQLVYGRKLDFDELPIKPASKTDEMKYWIKEFKKYKNEFRKKDKLGVDFSFRDFVKIIFYIANLQLQLIRKTEQKKRRYSEIANAFRTESNHIVHYSLELRKKESITNEEKQLWLDRAEVYVESIDDVIRNSIGST